MLQPITNILLENLKQSIADYFDINETFVDISPVSSSEDNLTRYRCELKLEIMGNNLKIFHLSIYTFYLEVPNEELFIYEGRYYRHDNILSFLKKLEFQVKELDCK